jgi:hypothetical protein
MDLFHPTREAANRTKAAMATLNDDTYDAAALLWQAELHKQLVKISRGVWVLVFLGLAILGAINDYVTTH